MIKTLKSPTQKQLVSLNSNGGLTILTCTFENAVDAKTVGIEFSVRETVNIDWGDGSRDTFNISNRQDRIAKHTYSDSFIKLHENRKFQISVDNNISGFWSHKDRENLTSQSGIRTLIVGLSPMCRKQYIGNNLFEQCCNLKTIPEDLFKYCHVDNFWCCFANTGLTYVPKDLFKSALPMSQFQFAFANCRDLQRCNLELSGPNSQTFTQFRGMFTDCVRLETINENLFKSVGLNSDFMTCFSGCRKLKIPTGIFGQPFRGEFLSVFNDVLSSSYDLATIPTDLFSQVKLTPQQLKESRPFNTTNKSDKVAVLTKLDANDILMKVGSKQVSLKELIQND